MSFRCPSCEREFDTAAIACDRCGSFVHFACDDQALLEHAVGGDFWAALPSIDAGQRVSMGEANTPLVELSRLNEQLETTAHAKLESLNPTCSFKDRGSALAVSAVVEEDTSYEAVVVASTGNTATSVAAYAARTGVPCAILVPEGTATTKLVQAGAHDATVFAVDGDFSDCFERAHTVADERVLNATAVYSANPYVASADRTVAFELVKQLGEPPDRVVVPVGAGPLLGGVFFGFRELVGAGLTDTVPKMLCVQAKGCHPVVEAYEEDRPVTAWEDPITTGVDAIADPLRGYARDGEHTRQAVLASDGAAVALSDAVVHEWTNRLAATEGIYAEPASAASVAAIAESDVVESNETVVALITGHGLKEGDGEIEPAVTGTPERVRATLLD